MALSKAKTVQTEPGTKLFALGCGRCGCLATGSDEDEFEPVAIRLHKDADVLLVASGTRHTIILCNENKVWSCGDNVDGKWNCEEYRSLSVQICARNRVLMVF